MTITPTDLLEIERKARACQAEEAANPEAKTCHRPTPELVLRLVGEVRKQTASRDTQYLERCKAENERDELRAKADQLREQNAGMGVELLGKDDTIKDLRAKAAELEAHAKAGWNQANDEATALEKSVARVRELQAIVDSSQRKMWLSFRLGQFQNLHHGYSGRDALRAMKTDWDHLELPQELWPEFEREIMENDHPVGMLLSTTIKRAIIALAGRECPWLGEKAALAAQAQKGGDK